MSFSPSGPWDILKQLQYASETTYGTKVTSSPVYTSAGAESSIRENSQMRSEEYRQLGDRSIYKLLKFGEIHSLEVRYRPFNTTLMRLGTETANVNQGLTFLYTQNEYPAGSAVEMFSFFIGAITDRIRIEITESSVLITHNFLVKSIPAKSSTSGLTTPTYAGADTADPWTGLTGGATPMTINSVTYDTPRFAAEVTWQPEVIQPNGETTAKWIKQTNKTVNVDFDTWIGKNQSLQTDMLAFTARAATYSLNSVGPKLITLTDLYVKQLDLTKDAGGTSHDLARYGGQAKDLSITA